MKRCHYLLVLALSVVLAACETTPKVYTDYDPGFNFGSASSFAVMRPNAALAAAGGQSQVFMNDLTANRLTLAIENALSAKGFRIVPPEQADMIVTFFVTSENKTDIRTYNSGMSYGRCWDPYRCARFSNPQVDVRHYKEGTLFIDFLDTSTKKLEWRGVTSKRLPSKPPTEQDRQQIVREVVGAIIDQFPPY